MLCPTALWVFRISRILTFQLPLSGSRKEPSSFIGSEEQQGLALLNINKVGFLERIILASDTHTQGGKSALNGNGFYN